MRKTIATLAMVALAPFAFAQTSQDTGNVKDSAKVQKQESSETQAQVSGQHGLKDRHQGRDAVTRTDRDRGHERLNSDATVNGQVNTETRDRRSDVHNRGRTDVDVNVNEREHPRTEVNTTNVTRHEERAENRGGKFFFRDREIHRHPGFDRNDWHFRIGVHDREWYYTHYQTIVMIDGCWYYEDGGMLYPAYGFDPNCNYPDPYIVFQF